MYTHLAASSISFNSLKESDEFLNIILNNVSSCILILNNRMELISFNNALATLFPRTKHTNLNYLKCGEAIGCAHQIEEKKECGKSTKCKNCEIRLSAISAYLENKVTTNKRIVRSFYNEKEEKEEKVLNYSTRILHFEGEKYVILIIDNVDCPV